MGELLGLAIGLGSILVVVYSIWLIFFPWMVIKRMDKIIKLLKNQPR